MATKAYNWRGKARTYHTLLTDSTQGLPFHQIPCLTVLRRLTTSTSAPSLADSGVGGGDSIRQLSKLRRQGPQSASAKRSRCLSCDGACMRPCSRRSRTEIPSTLNASYSKLRLLSTYSPRNTQSSPWRAVSRRQYHLYVFTAMTRDTSDEPCTFSVQHTCARGFGTAAIWLVRSSPNFRSSGYRVRPRRHRAII